MSYDVYWVKNRAEKIADFEHPTYMGAWIETNLKSLICFPVRSHPIWVCGLKQRKKIRLLLIKSTSAYCNVFSGKRLCVYRLRCAILSERKWV